MKVRWRRLGVGLMWGLLGLLVFSISVVTVLRWIDPPGSSFIGQAWIGGWIQGRDRPWVRHEWVPWEDIAPAVPLAVVAAEDQRFPEHVGFDRVELEKAWRNYPKTGRLRGASTLSQQVAKNLFLWGGRSIVRKGCEAWFTLLIELTWSKQRILEVYLNIAQFGPDTYGVGAASWRYFDRPPALLTEREAALLAAVLPNPELYRVDAPSTYVQRRAAWVRKQMRQLGSGYLDGLASH